MTDFRMSAWHLRSSGWRLLRFATCRTCGARLWFWRLWNAGHDFGDKHKRDGKVHPFDYASSQSHFFTCPDSAAWRNGRLDTSRSGRPGSARQSQRDQEGTQAGSGRDEPVVRMRVCQAGEQVTRRAEPRATPLPSASRPADTP